MDNGKEATMGEIAASETVNTPATEVVETPAAPIADAPLPDENPVPDRSKLISKVEKGLAHLREIDEPTPAAEEPEPSEETETPAEEKAPAEGEETAETTEEQPPKATKPTGPTLPGHLRRSLQAYGWSDEDIAEAFKASPTGFTLTAQKIHNNRNTEVARWAEAGRAARQQMETPAAEQPAAKVSPHVDAKTGQFKPLDIEAMVEKYGNEDLVREIATPVNEILKQVNSVLPDLMVGVKTVQQSRAEALSKTIDQFFMGKELESFTDHYGKESASLSKEQIDSRNKVLEMADALISGAKQQGRTLGVDEALMLAHDSVSSTFKEKVVRQQLKASVQKRNAGITLKPTSGSKGDANGPAKNKSEMESRAKSRLAAVFGN